MRKKLSGKMFYVLFLCFNIICILMPQGSHATINYDIYIENLHQPMAAVSKPYSYQLEAFAGGTYTWSIVAGNLPGGLHLDSSTGIISGTPVATGFSTFTVQATSLNGAYDQREFAMTIYKENVLVEGYHSVNSVLSDIPAYGIAVDNARGYIYTAGEDYSYYSQKMTLKRYEMSSGGEDPNWIPQVLSGDGVTGAAYSVAADQEGYVYLAGSGGAFVFVGENGNAVCQIDDMSWNAVALGQQTGEYGVFYLANETWIRKYVINYSSQNCSLQWAYLDMNETPIIRKKMGLAVDWDGNVYASYNKNIVKVDPSGQFEWKLPFPEGNPADVAVDSHGYLYATGTETYGNNETRYVTAKFAQNGQSLWTYKFRHQGGAHSANAIAVSGDVAYVTGTVGYAHNALFEMMRSDVLTIMYDLNGNWKGAKVFDTEIEDRANGIALGSGGNVYIAGDSIGYWSDYSQSLLLHYYAPPDYMDCNPDLDVVSYLGVASKVNGVQTSATSVGNKVVFYADLQESGCQPEYSFQTARLGPNGQDNYYNYIGGYVWYPSNNMQWDTTGFIPGTYRIRVFARNSNGSGRSTQKSWIIDNFELTTGSSAPKPDTTPGCDENINAVTQLIASFTVDNLAATSAKVGDIVVMRANTVGTGCGVEYSFRTTRVSPTTDSTFFVHGGSIVTVSDSAYWDTKNFLPGTYTVDIIARNGNGPLKFGQYEKKSTVTFTLNP